MFDWQMQNQVKTESQKVKQHYLGNEKELHYILNQDPELGNAIASGDDLLLE